MILVLLINALILLSNYYSSFNICYTFIKFLFIIHNSIYVHCSSFNFTFHIYFTFHRSMIGNKTFGYRTSHNTTCNSYIHNTIYNSYININ